MKALTFFLLFSMMLGHVGMGLYGTSLYTYAYFYDTEQSKDNVFIAGEIDFLLEATTFTPTTTAISLSPNDLVQKTVTVLPENSNPFKYTASTTNVTGDANFCAALNVGAEVEGNPAYDDLLLNMVTDATTTLDTWEFSIGMGTNNFQNSICNFDTEYFGSQTRHDYNLGEGYNDTEVIENTIASWGFRLNKIYYDVDREIIVDPEINLCEARSQGYWGNHEGCSMGTGSSDWETEINDLSSTFSGVFGSTSGSQICDALHIPLCPSGGTTEGKLCRAENKLLADELNVVTGKIDINAIIAGADDGDSAFDDLGLTSLSRISVALAAIEAVLANASSTDMQIVDAGYVAERIYAFYEDENPESPMCLYDEEYLESFVIKEVEGENEWVEIYNQTNVAIDINGWEICDNYECDVLSATDLIPPQGYGLITASSTTASNTLPAFWYLPDGVVPIGIPDSRIGNGLSNNDDMLILKRPDGVIVDQMNYGDADMGWTNYNDDVWNPGAPDVNEGNVLARVPSGYDTNQPSDWVELMPPSVDLIYPDELGSYTWYWNQMYTILWSAINNNGDDADLDIKISYVKDINQDSIINDGDDMITIVEDTDNDGEYEWTVPSGFIGFIWIYLVATGPENPMLNTAQLSGEIWDPIALFIGSREEELLMDLASVDTEAPVITITGNNPALIELGAIYNDLGAQVYDNVNTNLGITTENLVDSDVLGEYEVTYTATDQAGNTITAIRTVIVYDRDVGPPVWEDTEPVPSETSTTTVVASVTPEESGGGSTQNSEPTSTEEPTETETATSTQPVIEEIDVATTTATSTEPVVEDPEPIVASTTATSSEEVAEEPVEEEVATSTEPIIENPIEPIVASTTATSTEEIAEEPIQETATSTSPIAEEPVVEESTQNEDPIPDILENPASIEDPIVEPSVDETTTSV